MGQNHSQQVQYHKVERIMPPIRDYSSKWGKESGKPFTCEADREQFIWGALSVISQNGSIDLRDHEFRLYYSRREDERLVACLVAEKDGVIIAKVEPARSGETQAAAFEMLQKDIEMRLSRILQNVPGGDAFGHKDGSSSHPVKSVQTLPGTERKGKNTTEAPPAYGKAVGEWKADEGKKG